MKPAITKAHLDALIAPRSVALIGASDNPARLTARPLSFLTQHGFPGRIYPVNPVRETVMGRKSFPSVTAIPEPVDHAYILLDADPAIAAFRDCAEAGVKAVSVLADGFAEAGELGRERQARLTAMAEEAGILLLGPNSMGVVNTANGFVCTTNAAFRTATLPEGRLAALSQSGSVIGTLVSRGADRGIGFSVLISVGNEAAAGIGALGALLVDDPGTDGFVLFMETIREPAALAAFARRAYDAGKPVVAYMIGRTEEGQALSVSHTGALTGSAEAAASFLRSVGIRRAEQFETLLEAPAALSLARKAERRPKTVTVVSTTGGGGAMVVDQISARGVGIAGCSAAAREKLEARNIPLGHGKLVDVTLAGTKYETMKEVVSTLIEDPETGLLVVSIGSSAQFNPELAVRPIIDAVAEGSESAAPVVAFPLPHAPESLRMLQDGGVPSFRTVESCAEAVALLMNARPPTPPAEASLPADALKLLEAASPGVMDEVEAGAVFAALGMARPAGIVIQSGAALPETLPFAYPVVAKLVSPDLPHKTEAGAVRVGVMDRHALAEAIADMLASAAAHAPGFRFKGILIQEMRTGLGEALAGFTRDPLAGPMVTVGMGGVLAEIYRDASVRPAPVSIETAREMIAEVKGFALFRGFRGKPRGDLEALARAVCAVSMLAACDRVAEAEINPALVKPEGEGVVPLDALIRCA
jgi:acyl-CoA synthetase (NDP forming)